MQNNLFQTTWYFYPCLENVGTCICGMAESNWGTLVGLPDKWKLKLRHRPTEKLKLKLSHWHAPEMEYLYHLCVGFFFPYQDFFSIHWAECLQKQSSFGSDYDCWVCWVNKPQVMMLPAQKDLIHKSRISESILPLKSPICQGSSTRFKYIAGNTDSQVFFVVTAKKWVGDWALQTTIWPQLRRRHVSGVNSLTGCIRCHLTGVCGRGFGGGVVVGNGRLSIVWLVVSVSDLAVPFIAHHNTIMPLSQLPNKRSITTSIKALCVSML